MVYLLFDNFNVNKTARACVPRKCKVNNSNNSASAHSHDNCAIATESAANSIASKKMCREM